MSKIYSDANGNIGYRDGTLFIEGISVAKLAKEYGTPLWVYSGSRIQEQARTILHAFAGIAKPYFAVKANSNIQVLRMLRKIGFGFDVVSGSELYFARQAGAKPEQIVFAGANKSDEELIAAIQYGIRAINVESAEELVAINKIAGKLGKVQRVNLRVVPGIDPHTLAAISTGQTRTKFGMTLGLARQILIDRVDYPNVNITGIHFHVGSQIHDPQVYVASLDRVLPLIEDFDFLESLDLGGGFPVSYHAKDIVLTLDEFANAIRASLRGIRPLDVSIEPGRFVVADAGILVAEVQSAKMAGGIRIVGINAGMATLARPSLYKSYHEIIPVSAGENIRGRVDVAGPACESTDFLGKNRRLPELHRYDLLAALTGGAYCKSMSSNYNGVPYAPEVMVFGQHYDLISLRQPEEDLVKNEIF